MRLMPSRRLLAVVLGLLAAVLPAVPAAAEGPVITTVAGSLPSGLPGTAVSLKPSAVAFGPDGDLYIADPGQGVVWRQKPDGTVFPIAGTGRLCLPDPDRCWNEGGAAEDTFFKALSGIAVGGDGDIYVSEHRAHVVRRIDAQSGTVTVFAGNGSTGYSEDHEEAPAIEASLYFPGTLAFDSVGNLYIADIGNRRVRRVTPDGVITSVAGCGGQAWPSCFHYARDGSPMEGTPIGFNAGINGNGWAIAISPSDQLYIADAAMVIRANVADGVYEVVVGEGFQYADFPGQGEDGPAREARVGVIVGMAFGPDGSLYLMEGGGSYVQPWNRVQKVEAPVGPDSIIRHVGGRGVGGSYSGDGGDARKATFNWSQPSGTWTGQGMAVDAGGSLYLTDVRNERLRRIDGQTNIVTTHAGNGYGGAAYYMYTAPDFHPIGGVQKALTLRGGFSGDGRQATTAQLFSPYDVDADHLGNVYVLDRYNQRVRRIGPDGVITTIAGSGCVGEDCWEQHRDAPLGDGGPATKAQLLAPSGIALDRTGTQLYIADGWRQRVRQVNLGSKPFTAYPLSSAPITIQPGQIETVFGDGVKASFPGVPFISRYQGCALLKPYCGEGLPATYHSANTLGDIAADADGNLYVADSYANQVWKVDAATSTVTTVVGVEGRSNCQHDPDNNLPGRATQLCTPTSLHVGPDGDLYVAESGGVMGYGESLAYGWAGSAGATRSRIRRVDLGDPLHRSTVIAGGGIAGYGGDGGPATKATVAFPRGIAVASDGTVYFADTGNQRIRKIAPDGTISTVAGVGAYVPGNTFYSSGSFEGCDLSGDGGPAGEAELCVPIGIAFATDGTLLVADAINNRVRAISGL